MNYIIEIKRPAELPSLVFHDALLSSNPYKKFDVYETMEMRRSGILERMSKTMDSKYLIYTTPSDTAIPFTFIAYDLNHVEDLFYVSVDIPVEHNPALGDNAMRGAFIPRMLYNCNSDMRMHHDKFGGRYHDGAKVSVVGFDYVKKGGS